MAAEIHAHPSSSVWTPSARSRRGWPVRTTILLVLVLAMFLVEALLAGRILVTISGADEGLAPAVLSLSEPLVQPFLTDDPPIEASQVAFQPEALVALVFYGAAALVAGGLVVLSALLSASLGSTSPKAKPPTVRAHPSGYRREVRRQ